MTQVLITVDTELSIGLHKRGWSLADNLAASIDGRCAAGAFGVGHQLDGLARRGLKATFFVDPMPCALFGLDWLRPLVGAIVGAGQSVQLHIHPGWLRYVPGNAGWRACKADNIGRYDLDTQLALIGRARDWLVAAGAAPPVAFRAGNYGADDRTLAALARLGLAWDSSFNPGLAWRQKIALPRATADAVRAGDVLEAPVSAIEERPGRLRFAQVNAMSAGEMRAALDHAARARLRLFTIVTHSFELLTRDRARPNKVVAARWDALLDHLARRRDALPTAFFTELEPAPAPSPAPPRLGPSRWRTARREARQAWANWRYEAA